MSTNDMKPTIRTITVFLTLQPENFDVSWSSLFTAEDLEAKMAKCSALLQDMENEFKSKGYTVQTLRIATNPFGEWMTIPSKRVDSSGQNPSKKKKSKIDKLGRLERLDQVLANHQIDFCSVGPARDSEETKLCIDIVSQSPRFSCSKIVDAGDVQSANDAAKTILAISKLGEKPNAPKHVRGGLGNFRFCTASYCRPGIPFFPAAKAESNTATQEMPLKFAIGLENGPIVQELLKQCKSIRNIRTEFSEAFAQLLEPIQEMSTAMAKTHNATFLGIDTSLNPSLEESGSVATAIEQLDEVQIFGGPGTLAAAAEITKVLQSLPKIDLTGYCGLMLPVLEDTRLAELANGNAGDRNQRLLRVSDLLSISSVCGVGIDTVPISEECTMEDLSSLILDVAGVAGRWNKSLSCRVFPVPGKKTGERTTFDSPYMVNSTIFGLL
jgi:uncharacterized protein (UPF0210 family)